MIINARALAVALGYETSIKTVNDSGAFELGTKDPFGAENKGMRRSRDKIPCVMSVKSG